MESARTTRLTLFLLLTFSSDAVGLYLISDYYMDEGFPSAFGMACGSSIKDDCLYVNSHFRYLVGIGNYDDDNDCTLVLNAGSQYGARYKLNWKWFSVEWSPNCTNDYVSLYESDEVGISNSTEHRYCGKTSPDFNSTQQYTTIKFKSDGSESSKGFRVMLTRTFPGPCKDGYFHCESEDRCIDNRLQCDGTPQCDDRTDEDGCSFWKKLIGGLLALGVAGMIGVFIIIACGCSSICVGYCICKKCCCKKRSGKVADVPRKEPVNNDKEQDDSSEHEEEEPEGVKTIVAVRKSPTSPAGLPTRTVNASPSTEQTGDRSKGMTQIGRQPDTNLTAIDSN